MSCNVTSLLASGKSFQSLSERDQSLVIAQLLCDISGSTIGRAVITVSTGNVVVGPNGLIDTTGTTTAGIQEAINALLLSPNSGTAGGGSILIGPGMFDTTSTVTIPAGTPYDLLIQGAGPRATQIRYTGANNGFQTSNGTSPMLIFTMRDLCMTYFNGTNQKTLFSLEAGLNEALIENCTFGTYPALATLGITSPYADGVPAAKVGVIGMKLGEGGGDDNLQVIRNCRFFGLAVGAWMAGDHSRIQNCFFGSCGFYFPLGVGTPGTSWSIINGQADNNRCAMGAGLVAASGFECIVNECQFSATGNGILNTDSGGALSVRNCLFEHTDKNILVDDSFDVMRLIIEDMQGVIPNNHLYHAASGVIGGVCLSATNIIWSSDPLDGLLLTINQAGANKLILSSTGALTCGALTQPASPLARVGNCTLGAGGTVTVANTSVTVNTVVMLTRKTSGGTPGTAISYTTSGGVGFTVTSDNVLDRSVYSYFLIENP